MSASASAPHATLLTANDVARLCHVDLKTIHNWAGKEKILHHRTPGRHLRFRRLDVIDFLRAYGYPVPASLTSTRPRVCLVDADTHALATARRVLARKFEAIFFADMLQALVSLATIDAEVMVLDDVPWLSASSCVERLRGIGLTRHLRFVVFSARSERRDAVMRAGAKAFVTKDEPSRLREALERICGA
jgi:CheY-like chemotaxis protein